IGRIGILRWQPGPADSRTEATGGPFRGTYCTKRRQGNLPCQHFLTSFFAAGSRVFRPKPRNLPKLGPGQLPAHFAYAAIVRKVPHRVTRFFATAGILLLGPLLDCASCPGEEPC